MPVRLLPAVCCLAVLFTATDAVAQNAIDAVPVPDATGLEPAVGEHLAEARRDFDRAAADARTSGGRLADAYGALARVYHAYELFGPAEAAYANALRLDARDATWLHLLGYLYQQTGRFEEAAARLSAAVRAAPADRAAALRLGDVWLDLGRLQDARLQFEALLDVFPASARSGLGEVALREGRYREAVEQLRGALDRAPQADALHYRLAMAYRGLGNVEEARRHLQRRGTRGVVAADPVVDALAALVRGERLLVIRGSRAYAAGQFREAADAFERALQAAPGSVPARVNLASALLQLGQASRALEQLQAAYALAPGDLSVGRPLAAALVRTGRRDDAIGVLTSMRRASPDDEDTVVGLAILLAERERFGEAIAVLDEAHARFPERTATSTTLARLLASAPERAQRNGARALELAERVYHEEPGASHAETVALALAELERCAEALEWMRRAVSAAEVENDPAEQKRLRGELPRYQGASCRAPGR